MNPHYQRGLLHYQQDRLDQAEAEFRQALAAEPHDPPVHGSLAICLADLKKYEEAEREARASIHLGPDRSFGHYALAYVLNEQDRLKEARTVIQEALALDPEDADYWSLLAGIEMQLNEWNKCLAATEQGLQADPEHIPCANLRAMALVHLGRKAEADSTLAGTLTRDPDNAFTHANLGWSMLHRGQSAEALDHFREALRIDPNLEWARAGIVEAMKARNIVYRWLLRYFLWMSRLSPKVQWGVIIGFVVMLRVLRSVARSHPELQPYITPVLIMYLLFVLLTWIGDPLFNLLLRFNRFGRLALSPEQVLATNLFAVCLGLAGVSAGVYFWNGNQPALVLALVSAAMSVPVAAAFRRPTGWSRTTLSVYTIILVLLGLAAVAGGVIQDVPGSARLGQAISIIAITLFGIGWLLFGWVANVVSLARTKR